MVILCDILTIGQLELSSSICEPCTSMGTPTASEPGRLCCNSAVALHSQVKGGSHSRYAMEVVKHRVDGSFLEGRPVPRSDDSHGRITFRRDDRK